MKIAGIVVLYNPSSKERDCILTYYSYFDFLFLIDNSSTNNSSLLSNILASNVLYFPLMRNTGISHALNYGVAKARSFGCDAFMTLDQDSSFKNNIVEIYKNFMSTYNTKNVCALTPQYAIDRKTIKGIGKFSKVTFSMQSGTLFLLEKFSIVGPFDENIFLDGVDADYFARIKINKLKTIRCNEAILLHNPAHTTTVKIGFKSYKIGKDSPYRYYCQISSCVYMMKKYHMFYFLKWALIKYFKAVHIFSDRETYRPYCKFAIQDGKRGVFRTQDKLEMDASLMLEGKNDE